MWIIKYLHSSRILFKSLLFFLSLWLLILLTKYRESVNLGLTQELEVLALYLQELQQELPERGVASDFYKAGQIYLEAAGDVQALQTSDVLEDIKQGLLCQQIQEAQTDDFELG